MKFPIKSCVACSNRVDTVVPNDDVLLTSVSMEHGFDGCQQCDERSGLVLSSKSSQLVAERLAEMHIDRFALVSTSSTLSNGRSKTGNGPLRAVRQYSRSASKTRGGYSRFATLQSWHIDGASQLWVPAAIDMGSIMIRNLLLNQIYGQAIDGDVMNGKNQTHDDQQFKDVPRGLGYRGTSQTAD